MFPTCSRLSFHSVIYYLHLWCYHLWQNNHKGNKHLQIPLVLKQWDRTYYQEETIPKIIPVINISKHYLVKVKSSMVTKEVELPPERAKKGSILYRISTISTTYIPPNSIKYIPNGLSMKIPQVLYDWVQPKTSPFSTRHLIWAN